MFSVGCCVKKQQIAVPESARQTIHSLPEGVYFSPGFMLFWEDLGKDSEGYDMDNYIPGESFVSKYKLRNTDGVYFVSGFIKIKENFDKEAFNSLGGLLTGYTVVLHTFHIPVKNIPAMIKLDNIERIEIANNIKVKR
jgi:hypothetical protein